MQQHITDLAAGIDARVRERGIGEVVDSIDDDAQAPGGDKLQQMLDVIDALDSV